MDYERRDANDILADLSCECSYIEYKASASQLAKILKTICAYGNNLVIRALFRPGQTSARAGLVRRFPPYRLRCLSD